MLFLISASFAVLIIFFAFGDSFLTLYNKICKTDERNSLIEKTILGMCVITLILSVSSLFFLSSHYILLVFTLFAIFYLAVNKRKTISICKNIFNYISFLSKIQLIILFLILIVIYIIYLYGYIGFDEGNYYMQTVMWNESYPVIPGLANLEERQGFNSNFFLLSSPFTFKFILGSPVFFIHIIFAALVFVWLFKECVDSAYEIKRTVLLILYIVYLWMFVYLFYSISNDAIIHIIIFYLIAKTCLYPKLQKEKFLFYIITLVYLATIKISISPLSFILILYFLYLLIKAKKIKNVSFILSISLLLLSIWCLRNVIISGYLIYPLYELDLFEFDWKIPIEIAVKERNFINYGLEYVLVPFRRVINGMKFFPYAIPLKHLALAITYIGVVISTFGTIIFLLFKNKSKKVDQIIYWIFVAIIFQILVNIFTNGNERFVGSILLLIIYIFIHILIGNKKSKLRITNHLILVFSFILLVSQVPQLVKLMNIPFNLRILFIPFDVNEKSHGEKDLAGYETIEINNGVSIYLARSKFVYDVVPAVTKLSEGEYVGRFQSYNKIEARGNYIENGFRYKEDK